MNRSIQVAVGMAIAVVVLAGCTAQKPPTVTFEPKVTALVTWLRAQHGVTSVKLGSSKYADQEDSKEDRTISVAIPADTSAKSVTALLAGVDKRTDKSDGWSNIDVALTAGTFQFDQNADLPIDKSEQSYFLWMREQPKMVGGTVDILDSAGIADTADVLQLASDFHAYAASIPERYGHRVGVQNADNSLHVEVSSDRDYPQAGIDQFTTMMAAFPGGGGFVTLDDTYPLSIVVGAPATADLRSFRDRAAATVTAVAAADLSLRWGAVTGSLSDFSDAAVPLLRGLVSVPGITSVNYLGGGQTRTLSVVVSTVDAWTSVQKVAAQLAPGKPLSVIWSTAGSSLLTSSAVLPTDPLFALAPALAVEPGMSQVSIGSSGVTLTLQSGVSADQVQQIITAIGGSTVAKTLSLTIKVEQNGASAATIANVSVGVATGWQSVNSKLKPLRDTFVNDWTATVG